MPGGAGPLALGEAPEVDVPTAKELIDEVYRHVDHSELGAIVAELGVKAACFDELLGPNAIERLDAGALREALAWTFAARRRASVVIGARGDDELRAWIGDLLYGSAPLAERFERFCVGLALGEVGVELAGELLHFTAPDRYWLCSRWVWSPESRTGALPLLIAVDFDLDEAEGPGATYERVGAAMAALDASPEAASFRAADGARLATDVFLVAVYGVYMQTVLGLKLSREFNAVVPPIPELARRLLGIHRREG
jgi:hypothetical protein